MNNLTLSHSPFPALSSGEPVSLFDQIIDPANLLAGWRRVRRKKGAHGGDGVTWQRFEKNLESNLDSLHRELSNGHYRPGRMRNVRIEKKGGGHRKLRIPPIRDRVAQAAAALVLTERLDPLMSHQSFAYRPGRSVEMALHQVRDLMASGHVWIVDLDIKKYFDRIPHQRLMMELAIWVSDERFLALAARWLRSFCFWRSILFTGRGVAQGSPLSPLLANLYLHPVDRLLAAAGLSAIRYADDILVLCETRTQAEQARDFLESLIIGRGLSINRQKSSILHASQPFTFLGQELGGPDFAARPVIDLEQMARQAVYAEENRQDETDLKAADPASVTAPIPAGASGAGLALEDQRAAPAS